MDVKTATKSDTKQIPICKIKYVKSGLVADTKRQAVAHRFFKYLVKR
jgi:hypothetical protein